MTRSVAMISGTAWYLWNFRRNVIKGFVNDGWVVHVIAGPDDWSAKLGALPGVERHDWRVSLDGANPIAEFSALLRLMRLIRRIRPRIMFNNGIKANVYGGLTARFLGAAFINNISGLGMRIRRRDRMARVLARLYAYASAGADALLIQNMCDLAFLQENGLPDDVRFIRTMGSGVDLTHFRVEPLPACPPFRVLFAGRLQKDKGIFDFVDAARLLKGQNPELEFTVLGGLQHANSGGVPADTLAAWERCGMVTFLGHQADVRPYLAQSHVLVMPSHGGEGLPKIILEAAAMGRPVIVSDIAGCRDSILPGDTGLLAPPRNPAGLAQVIESCSRMPEVERQSMSLAARAHAEATFSDERITEVSLELGRESLGSFA